MTERDTSPPSGNLLTPQEAARRLGVSERTLHRYEGRGLIRAQRLPSGIRRYDRGEIERHIEAAAAAASAPATA